jgi:hypothetical protein
MLYSAALAMFFLMQPFETELKTTSRTNRPFPSSSRGDGTPSGDTVKEDDLAGPLSNPPSLRGGSMV